MVNTLPAILIGGPPHAGKSVLFYSLTKALHERDIPHHALRACPDGEGNWYQEIPQERAQTIRIKGEWTSEFVERITQDISRRLLPLLVDMGGYPRPAQIAILRQCTHSLLLLHEQDLQSSTFWQNLVETCGLLPLAQLNSQLAGDSVLTASKPVIRGTVTQLKRHSPLAQGVVFNQLVEQISTLFSSNSNDELEQIHLDLAPTELVITLPQLLRTLTTDTDHWRPSLLPHLLHYLPASTPLSVYGRGPQWLYAAIAAYVDPHEFYQFDPRLRPNESSPGWIVPPPLHLGEEPQTELSFQCQENATCTRLTINILKKHLDYFHAHEITFPQLPTSKGLILDGVLPSWLLVALALTYKKNNLPWIACYAPRVGGGIIVFSRVADYQVGDVIAL